MTIWSAEIKELERLYESFKGRLPDLEKEWGHLIKTDDENVALLYSRRCLEIIINELCETELKRPRKTEPLKGIIDKLNREEKVPSHIIASMLNLNSLSTFGTHPKEFDPEQVRPVLINLATIMKWYLKHKDILIISKPTVEEEKHEMIRPDDVAEHIRKPKKRLIISFSKIALFIVIVIVIGGLFLLFYSGETIPFEKRDWIVITDFENLTGESIFDHSLNTAFTLSINQSRYLNVITRQRMLETLERMQKEGREYIDEETGREIAMREGVKICIVPSISKIGTQYILTVKILDSETAEILRSDVLYAKSQDEIIQKLDQLTKRIRRNLGESRYKIAGQSKSLAKVTTSSLEALKQYSLGIENHLNADFEKARSHYENALRIDSNFTAAKASLGNILFEIFNREIGCELLKEAILTIDNLTEREKLGILAFYAVNVENDMDKGIEFTKTLIELYPDDAIPHNNLGWYYQNMGNYEKAVEEYKIALRIDPYFMISNNGLVWTYLECLGQIDSAMNWVNRMIKYVPDNPWGYYYLGSTYVGMDDLEQAEAAYLKAKELDPDFYENHFRLAHVYRLQGKYDKAIEVLEEILCDDPENKFPHYVIGVNYTRIGKSEDARNHFLEYKKIAEKWLADFPDNPETFISNGILLTWLGEKDAGWEIGQRALELDSTIHYQYARLLTIQGRKSEALDHLEKALENGYHNLVWLKLDPDLQSLHGEARFQELIDKFFKQN